MRIVYFGTSEFAIPALKALKEHVVLVVCQPDRPSGRKMQLKPAPVKQAALELGLPVETPEKARDPEFVELIRNLEADVHVVAAYGQILSVKLLETAKRGGINLHGSILPKYRGAAPIQRAILNEEPETGVTLMQMDKGMDTGDMIDIVRTPIQPDETYGELQERLSHLAAEQISDWIERIVGGNYPRIPQDHDQATYAPKVDREERVINLNGVASREYARFKAFTPNPGTFIPLQDGTRLNLVETRLGASSGEVGTLLSLDPCVVSCALGSLVLLTVKPEGKPAMSGEDWARGRRLELGSKI